jgi:CheY-like chemotaxis protein
MRILVVDDVGYVRHTLDRLLSQHGHSVVTAGSGIQALEILKHDNGIQVVITDLLMPGMDGIELFKAAQKIDRIADKGSVAPPTFYLITALRPTSTTPIRETSMLQQAVNLGFADVLLKPIDSDHLLRSLSNLERRAIRGTGGQVDEVIDYRALLRVLGAEFEPILQCEDVSLLKDAHDILDNYARKVEMRMRELKSRPQVLSGEVEETLLDLHNLTESVLKGEDSDALLAVCRQLESQAEKLKHRLAAK